MFTRAVARAKHRVPERAWPVLLSLRSLAGDTPLVVTPSLGRVLVLAPHPDDESVGCGGTLALLSARGSEIDVVFATSGEATRGSALRPTETKDRRQAEARAACALLGTRPPRFLDYPDGELRSAVDDLASRIAVLVRESTPDAIFVPWFLDGHEDHRAVNQALAAIPVPDSTEIWAFETWTPLPANHLVDISTVIERKQKAIAAHATAHLAFDAGAIVGLNRYRSLHGLMGRGHAEAFLALPAPDYAGLVARVD